MRVLDLFCGAGGAAMGLHRAWPDAELVGIDIKPQPRYPFKFVQGDVMDHFDPAGASFDFVWASPPCQRYSCVTPKANRKNHPDLIGRVREALIASESVYVIENVPGARRELHDPIMLCGSMFGLRTRRHRWFESSFPVQPPKPCDHSETPLLVTTAGANSRAIGNFKSVRNAEAAYGINWMDGNGLKEAIPPAYSEYIAKQSRKV